MKELKAKHAFDVYEDYTKTGDDEQAQVYLKSEVDSVLAEKDKLIAKLKAEKARISESRMAWANRCGVAEESERHQKYKRCLAMSEWCDAEADVADATGDYNGCWFQNWHDRWLALAEKFEEDECR